MRQLESPTRALQILYRKIRQEWKAAFLACFLLGLVVHMPILISDIPNHDGLDSMYFDQNMITSGRWFLTVACGISSYYTLPMCASRKTTGHSWSECWRAGVSAILS